MRPAGADPTAPAKVVLAQSLQPGRNYTVAAIGPKASLRGLLLRDDLSPVSPGKARVRFVDTLLGQRAIDAAVRPRYTSPCRACALPVALRGDQPETSDRG